MDEQQRCCMRSSRLLLWGLGADPGTDASDRVFEVGVAGASDSVFEVGVRAVRDGHPVDLQQIAMPRQHRGLQLRYPLVPGGAEISW